MRAIYRMHIDCGRQGELTGIFTALKEDVDRLIKSGVSVEFGEVLGKHSDVRGRMTEEHFTLVTEDQNVVGMFEEYDFSSGYSPFDYVDDDAITEALAEQADEEGESEEEEDEDE